MSVASLTPIADPLQSQTPPTDLFPGNDCDVSLRPPSANSRATSGNSRLSGKSIRAPSNRQSAKFKRTPVSEKLLLTELGDSDIEDDVVFSQDLVSISGSDRLRHSDVTSGPRDELDGYEDEDRGAQSDETELDVDIDGLLYPDRIIHDTSGRTEYMRACSREDTTPISLFLRNLREREFVMKYRGLGPQGTKALSVPLESNTTIERLDLEGNFIDAQGARHLADMLKENYYISELLLAENKLGTAGVKCLCNVLQDNTTVLKLDLSGNSIEDDAAVILHDMLKKNSSLKQLVLSHNEIRDSGARLFKEVLADNESLELLDLSWNQIRTQGAIWLAEGIQENIGLKYFNLSMNGMGLDGACEMGKALKQNRSLLELDISYNRLPQDGVTCIASGIQANDTLRTLKVGANPIGEDGAMALLTAVDRNDCTALTFLDLTSVIVTGAFEEMRKRMEKEKQVRVVHGGVVGSLDSLPHADLNDTVDSTQSIDPLEAFRRDPMTKLKQYVQAAGLRMVDMFKQFDKDQSMTVSREEFVRGITKANIGLSEAQIEILLNKMDKDHDGEIDFGELVYTDREYREMQRNAMKLHQEFEANKSVSPRPEANKPVTPRI